MLELERIFSESSSLSNVHLAEQSGFGSFNSMKRAIENRTGLSITEWKKEVMKGKLNVG